MSTQPTTPKESTMSTTPTLYKAFDVDGKDFNSHTVDYASAFAAGETIKHPRPRKGDGASGYLSVTDNPLELPGARWPLVLWEVEVVGESWRDTAYNHKHACFEVRGIRQVESHLALGPNGEQVAAVIDTWLAIPYDERRRIYELPRSSDWWAAYDRAYDAADSLGVVSSPARFGLRLSGAVWSAGLGGALAVLVRDAITRKDIQFTKTDYETLTSIYRAEVGVVHPDDTLPAKGRAA